MNERYALCRGFSLIELTVVLLLITLIASVAVRETSELAFQARYEQTKERLEMIKQAILGNPRQIVNGQQAISGFVADMGRLPVDLHELLEPAYCRPDRDVNWKNNPTDADTVCDTNYGVGSWVSNKLYQSGYCLNGTDTNQASCEANSSKWIALGFGWHGPYLNVSGSPADADVFPDGWGNQATVVADQNYGWRFKDLSVITANNADIGNLIIQSLGKNQQLDNGLPVVEDYDADYPTNLFGSGTTYYPKPAIFQKDWLVDISSGISANFAKSFGSNAHCGFLNADATTNKFNTPQKCLNAGGTWSGSTCTAINETSCKSVGGKWQSCFFSPATCVAAGGTSSTGCRFSKKSCIAATGNIAAWDTTNNICNIAVQTDCENANGTWNGTVCSFSNNACSLAGGAWVQDCGFTSSACTSAGGANDAGQPVSCGFTQANCLLLNGISNGSDCYMSHAEAVGTRYAANSCKSALGKWTGQICMNIFYRDKSTNTINVASSEPVVIDENGAFSTQLFTGFNDGGEAVKQVPIGQNAIGIYEWDGDCDPVNNLYPPDRQNPIQVDFHPHTTLPVINW